MPWHQSTCSNNAVRIWCQVYSARVTSFTCLQSMRKDRRMMTSSNGNIFRVTDPLWGESTGHRWIPLTKASDVEHWYFLRSASEQTFGQTIETPLIRGTIALIMTSQLWCWLSLTPLEPVAEGCRFSHWRDIKSYKRDSLECLPSDSGSVTVRRYQSDVTWAPWCLMSQAIRLFVQQPVRTNNNENNEAAHHLPFVREIHRSPVDSTHKGPIVLSRVYSPPYYCRVFSTILLSCVCLRHEGLTRQVPGWCSL